MLDLFGSGYVIDHCIAALKERNKNRNLEYYKTDILRGIYTLLYAYCTDGKDADVKRWAEIENGMKPQKEETRTAEEIISGINNKLKKFGGEKS